MTSEDVRNLSPEKQKAWYEYCKRTRGFSDAMIHYREFVDKDISKRMIGYSTDWDTDVIQKWASKVKPIYDKIPKCDYDNSILFICNEAIKAEVFFSAFLRLSKIVGFQAIDIMTIQDLWYGRNKRKNYSLDELEDLHSFQDIREDVLCFYVTSNMIEVGKVPEIMITLMSARSGKNGRKSKNQNTWIYYQGTIDELRNSRFSLWESFFDKNGLIIDLNPQRKENDFVSGDIYSPF